MKKEPVYTYGAPVSVKRLKPGELPDIALYLKGFAYSKHTNRARVAKAMGMSRSALANLLKSRNPRIELLVALSQSVEYNLLEFYISLMPERLRGTTETRKLQEQLDQMEEEKETLQQKLEASERERELLLSLLQGQRR